MSAQTPSQDIVVDRAASRLSDLWTREDYWAIWVGFFLILVACFIYFGSPAEGIKEGIAKTNAIMKAESERAPFKTVAYYKALAAKSSLRGTSSDTGKMIANLLKTPGRWSDNPAVSFFKSQADVDVSNAAKAEAAAKAKEAAAAALAAAEAAEKAAADAQFKDDALNAAAGKAAEDWNKAQRAASSAASAANAKPYNVIPMLLVFMVISALLFSIGLKFMGQNIPKYLIGFTFVFFIAVLAYFLGNQDTMRKYGVGNEAWAIVLGLIIANTVGTPNFVKPAVQTEYYIKTGLVLLGASVLFDKIVAIGIPGIFVAWAVTPTVLICTFIFGQKVLKMESKTLNIVISADMSVCGTSAAIATAAACRAKKEELTLAIGISLAFTAVMMVVMPIAIKAMGMPEVLAGAWIGGTIDATGAVAAAGAVLGEKAMYVAATIKMIQNILIGVTAFFVALYWTTKVDRVEGQKTSAMEIWHRFPKFVIGFFIASIFFSYLSATLGSDHARALLNQGALSGLLNPLRTWFFVFAFVSIGLDTNFREFAPYFKGGKPVILYVCGQSFNLVLTLLMAWIMFYKVFPEITASI